MDIFDEGANIFNGSATAAERDSDQIKVRLSELEKQKQRLCSELCATLFKFYEDSTLYPEGTESLFSEIAALDSVITMLSQQLAELSQPLAASQVLICQACGKPAEPYDAFCGACGTPIERPAPSALPSQVEAICGSYGSELPDDQASSTVCEAKVEQLEDSSAASVPPDEPPIENTESDADASAQDIVISPTCDDIHIILV